MLVQEFLFFEAGSLPFQRELHSQVHTGDGLVVALLVLDALVFDLLDMFERVLQLDLCEQDVLTSPVVFAENAVPFVLKHW